MKTYIENNESNFQISLILETPEDKIAYDILKNGYDYHVICGGRSEDFPPEKHENAIILQCRHK